MELSFLKYSPTKNTTVLVETPVETARQAEAAAKLMAEECLCAEQVGFIHAPDDPSADGALRMMGGEFCGNATMSLGAYVAGQKCLDIGQTAVYRLQVSGASGLVDCSISRKAAQTYYGEVAMPLPREIVSFELCGRSVPLVRFDGIAHLLLAGTNIPDDEIRRALPRVCELCHADACGAIFADKSFDSIRPLVYVPSAQTFVYEHGCGSGTAAVGAYLSHVNKASIEKKILQPGGEMLVRTVYENGRTAGITIGGIVTLMCRGTVYIDL